MVIHKPKIHNIGDSIKYEGVIITKETDGTLVYYRDSRDKMVFLTLEEMIRYIRIINAKLSNNPKNNPFESD